MTIQRIVTIINLVLITLLAYLGVDLFYGVAGSRVPAFPENRTAEVRLPVPATLKKNPLTYYGPVIDRDLFKTKYSPPPKMEEKAIDLENLEQTKLKLKLFGTVSGAPQSAYAVIEDTQRREQNLFRVGDVIQAATLKAILREKVVLTVNGKDEILAMEELRPTTAAGPLSRSPAVVPDDSHSQEESPEQTQEGNQEAARTQRISLNRSMINEAMQDVSKLMTEIAITPNVGEDGKQSGLALRNIQPNSIFRRMGLRNGDILVGVDGQEIQSVDDAMRLYENLKSSNGVKVQIQRRGQERTIDYTIR